MGMFGPIIVDPPAGSLLRPPAAGRYMVAVDFLHRITGRVLATRTITVPAA
jgi:hypothetical protein